MKSSFVAPVCSPRFSTLHLCCRVAVLIAVAVGCTSSSDSAGGTAADAAEDDTSPDGSDGQDGQTGAGDIDASGEENIGTADAADSCPPAPCSGLLNTECVGSGGYTVCSTDADGCLVSSTFIPCVEGRQCAAGGCFGECITPEVVVVLDRSVVMKGGPFAEAFLGLKRGFERLAPGVRIGLVLAPGDAACGVGVMLPTALAGPESDNAATLVEAMKSAGTADVGVGDTLPLVAAFKSALDLLGDRNEGEHVVWVSASEVHCDEDADVLSALAGFQERDSRVHVLWLGDITGASLPTIVASGGGADSVRITPDDASVAQALTDIVMDAGACCIDPDGDERGLFCPNGLDCNEGDSLAWTSNCDGRQCGDDGCGSVCGTCPAVAGGTSECVSYQCVVDCGEGFHACGDACVSSDDVAHCAGGCTPCPAPSGGSALCSATGCDTSCPEGTHLCGDACVESDDPAHCGSSCDPCPSGPTSVATCIDGQCGSLCAEGAIACQGACVSCPTAGVEATGCSDAICVVTSCIVGYVPCDAGCCARVDELISTTATGVAMPTVAAVYPSRVAIAWAESDAVGKARFVLGDVGSLEEGDGLAETLYEGAKPLAGAYPRTLVDPTGTIRVAYRAGDTAAAAQIVVATRGAGGTWTTQDLVDTFDLVPYAGGDFGIDASPSAIAVSYPSEGQLGLARSNGLSVNWKPIANEPGQDYVDTPAVLIGQDGLIRVLAVEDADTVILLTGTDQSFTRQQIDVIQNVGPHRLDLAERSDGTVGYCWLDNTIGGQKGVLFEEEADGGSGPEPVVDPDGEEACEIAYDAGDTAILAYRRQNGTIGLATRLSDGSWSKGTVAAPSAPGFGLRWPSLAVHYDDALSVVYWNGDASSVHHVYLPGGALP